MSLCVYSMFVLFRVYVAALRRSPTDRIKDQETEKAVKVQQRALDP
jgi:hypothetical protein